MTACASTRGRWGGVCPDCGQRLPARPQPLRSWKAVNDRMWGQSFGVRGWTDAQREAALSSATFAGSDRARG